MVRDQGYGICLAGASGPTDREDRFGDYPCLYDEGTSWPVAGVCCGSLISGLKPCRRSSNPMVYRFPFSRVLFAALLVLFGTPLVSATDFYVAPNASANGNGSFSNPWKLQTALNQPAAVQPGDTIWLRGGTYTGAPWTSHLKGTAANPIIVRQYSGERARLDGNYNGNEVTLTIMGLYTWFWGFEVFNSDPTRYTSNGDLPPRRG